LKYICHTAKFDEDVLKRGQVVTSGIISVQQFDLELWPWPMKS